MKFIGGYMSKYINILIIVLIFIMYYGCTSINNSGDSLTNSITTDINLQNSLKMATNDIKMRLPQNSVVAIVNFDTTSINLSNYLIDELTSLLIMETKLRIVERRQLELIQEELNFQMSGAVSDDTAKSIGKFVGADSIITGTFFIIGNKYRLGIKSIHVETGIVQSLFISNVNIDSELSLIVRSTSTTITNIQQNRQTNIAVNTTQRSQIRRWTSSSVISPDGRWVINTSSYSNLVINIYDILDDRLLRSFPIRDPRFTLWGGSQYDSTNINMDGRIIVISSGGTEYSLSTFGRLLFYDILTGREINSIKLDGGGRSLTDKCYSLFNPIRNQILIAIGNKVHLIDLNNGNKRSILLNRSVTNGITSIVYSLDGTRIAVGDWNGIISVLDANTLRLISTLRGHNKAIRSLAFSPDNNILLSGSDDFTISVWDLSSRKELFVLAEHLGEINTVIFSLNGDKFISSSRDGTVKLWSTNTYSVIRNYTRPIDQFWPSNLSLTPDGNYFITQGGYLYKIE